MRKLLLAMIIALGLFACEKEEALNITPENDTVYVVNNYYNTDTLNLIDTINNIDSILLIDSILITDTIYRIDTIEIERIINPEEVYNYYVVTRSVSINIFTESDVIFMDVFDTVGFNNIEEFIIKDSYTNTIYDTLTINDFINSNTRIYDI